MSEYLHDCNEYNEHDILRARLLRNVDDSPVGDKTESMEELKASQTNQEFAELRMQRMLLGRFRYAKLSEQKRGTKRYKNLENLDTRLQMFKATGNGEHLVDLANMAEIVFTLQEHPNWHFESADDGDGHTEALL